MLRRNWKIISFIVILLITSTVALVEYRRTNVLKDRLGCVATWLEKANSLHTVQMKEPSNFTGDTMQKLMDSLDWAYDCATKDPSSGGVHRAGALSGNTAYNLIRRHQDLMSAGPKRVIGDEN